jgi:hypothetical protein
MLFTKFIVSLSDQAPDPSLAKQAYPESIIWDPIQGEQKIFARLISQFETPTSCYHFSQSPDNPPQAYMWMMVPAPLGPGFMDRLIPYDDWMNLEFAVGEVKCKELLRCLADGVVGLAVH